MCSMEESIFTSWWIGILVCSRLQSWLLSKLLSCYGSMVRPTYGELIESNSWCNELFQQGCPYGNRKEATNSIWMALVDIDTRFGCSYYGVQHYWILKNHLWWLWGELIIIFSGQILTIVSVSRLGRRSWMGTCLSFVGLHSNRCCSWSILWWINWYDIQTIVCQTTC